MGYLQPRLQRGPLVLQNTKFVPLDAKLVHLEPKWLYNFGKTSKLLSQVFIVKQSQVEILVSKSFFFTLKLVQLHMLSLHDRYIETRLKYLNENWWYK